METRARLQRLMQAPSSQEAWNLRGDLLQRGDPVDDSVWTLLEQLHDYLCQLESCTSAREYSNRASLLDIGAVGGVLLDNLMEARSGEEMGQRLLSALLSEGLMVLGTRQHVKAWEQELEGLYRQAAWNLYLQLWRWSEQLKPELSGLHRRLLVEQLLAPIRSEELSGTVKAVLITRYYQLLIWSCLRPAGSLSK